MCALVINLLIYFLSISGKRNEAVDKKYFCWKDRSEFLQVEEQSFFAVDIDFKEAFGTIRKPLSLGV